MRWYGYPDIATLVVFGGWISHTCEALLFSLLLSGF